MNIKSIINAAHHLQPVGLTRDWYLVPRAGYTQVYFFTERKKKTNNASEN